MLPPWPLTNTIRVNPWAMKQCGEVLEQIEVHACRGGERAGEVQVVVRIAEPLQRREQALPRDRSQLHAADDFAEEQRIGEDRHVLAVLFERRDGEDDRRGLGQRGHGGPGEFGEFHRAASCGRVSSGLRNSVPEWSGNVRRGKLGTAAVPAALGRRAVKLGSVSARCRVGCVKRPRMAAGPLVRVTRVGFAQSICRSYTCRPARVTLPHTPLDPER